MTLTMFAVPLQTFLTYNQELSVMSVLLNTLIMNFRFTLMSVVLLTIWKKPKILSVPSLHFLCSSTYLASIAEKKDESNWNFYLGLALTSYLVAISSTVLGYLIYQINHGALRALLAAIATIVLPIHFTCLTIKRKENKVVLMATLMGLIIAPIAIFLIGRDFLTLIFIIISYLMVLAEDKLCGKKIALATLVVTLLRALPAFFKLASRLDNFPRFSRFLDYLICLITGEIIYSVAFSRVNQYSSPMTMIVITILTIGLTAFTMHKTGKLSKSFITSFVFLFWRTF